MKTILLVEDDRQCGLLYEEELSESGYRVLRAMDGPQALQLMQQKPDLVVLDINLPGMNGLEVMGKLLAEDPRLPVILNSAYGAYQDDFLSWAANAYVIKSSDLSELKSQISEALTGIS